MTRVYLCEKPSQGSDIASVLGISSRGDGFINTKDGSVVTWARGHLVKLPDDPSEFNPEWGGYWNWKQLPMIPDKWKLIPVKDGAKQLKVIKTLLKTAKEVVIATDAGREGEMIARELLDYCGFKGGIKRLWLSSLLEENIRKGLANLLDGKEKAGLYEAALARSHSDWWVGFNLSRAATLAANIRKDFFPVGRVQTPVLAMVVSRDEAIANFVKRTYYEIEANVQTAGGHQLTLTYAPSEDKRIYDPVVALELCEKINGASSPLKVAVTNEKEGAPLPHSLTTLQREANRIYGFTADKTLSIAQELYEAKVITYPRTDCKYLPSAMIQDIPDMLDSVRTTLYAQVDLLRARGVATRPSTFNDAQLTDHHGIVPTKKSASLSGPALQMYQLICIRFLQSLGPDRLYQQTKISMDAGACVLGTSGRINIQDGWKEIKL